MEPLQEFALFTLLYFLLCCCIIYPPVEFVTSGITIESIFATYLKSESEQFVTYHLRRSCLNLFIYSLLPLIYVILLATSGYSEEIISLLSIFFWCLTTSTLVLPLLALYQIGNWCRDNWKDHPTVKNVSKFCNNNSDWSTVASNINNEFRRVDKICIRTNAICRVIATENWVMKVTPLTVFVVHQSDATLQVNQSDTHTMSVDSLGQVQFVNIEVKSSRPNVEPFIIRLNTLDFKDLSDRVARIITVLPNVKFHKSLMDKFIDAFKTVVDENARYDYQQDLENCIGCMQTRANVKLQKMCLIDEGVHEACVTCHCKPMWCIDCMAKWFASRQDSSEPETWLSSKCTCPMCRSTFCILDVSLLQTQT